MLRITRVEQSPFHTLSHRTSGSKGEPRRNRLPFYRAYATGLPPGMEAMVLTADLQGRENGGKNRLLGESVAETLSALSEQGIIPPLGAVVLCGDLFDYPDCHKRGGTGPVDEVFHAFSRITPRVIGVLGNHDELSNPEALPGNVRVLDGQVAHLSGLLVGGVGGIVGNPQRHQRRTEDDFLAAMESVTDKKPDLLLLHQGPDAPNNGQRGDTSIALSLVTGFAGLTVFGHTQWYWPWLVPMGAGQVLNVDARVVVVLKDEPTR